MRAIRYMVRFFLLLLLLAVTAVTAGYFYLRSDAGLDRLAREITTRASSDGQQITLDGLRGNLFGDITLARATLADREGVWLSAEGVHAVWSPRALARGEMPLLLVAAQRIALLRKPLPPETPQADEPAGAPPSLQALARYLPRRLEIKEWHVAEPVAGFDQRGTLTGGGDAVRYALNLATLEGVPLTLDAVVQPQQENFTASVHFKEEPGGVVAALAGLPNNIALAADAEIAADAAGGVRIEQATVQAGTLKAEAHGTYAVAQQQVDLTLAASAPDIEVVQAVSGMPMHGSATLTLRAQGTPDSMAVTLDAATPRLTVQDNRLENVTLQAQATVNPSAWGRADFAVQGKLQGEGRRNGVPFALAVQGNGDAGRVALSELAGSYGANRADGTLEARGSLKQFDYESALALTTAQGVGQFTLTGEIDRAAPHYQSTVKGRFTHQQQRFDLAAELAADAKQAEIGALSLEGPGVKLTGSGTLALEEKLAEGAWTVRATDLAPLGRMLGQPLAGALHADLTLARNGSRQSGAVKAKADGLALPGLTVTTATLDAGIADAVALEGVDATLDARGITAGTLQVTRADLQAKGGMERGLALTLNGQGTQQEKPWQLVLSGRAQRPAPQHYRMEIATLEGSYDRAPVRMAAPATLTHRPDLSSLSPLRLEVAGGTVRAEGRIERTRVNGTLAIDHLALDKLPLGGMPDAAVDATLTVTGTAAEPVLAWQAESRGTFDAMPFTASLRGGWQQRRLQSQLTMQADEAKSELQLTLPARLSLQPFATDLGARTALQGTLSASLPLGMFNARLRPQGHRLEGLVAGDATLAGTLGDPYFNGAFALSGGRYDHNPTGICLRDMQASITGSREAVRLDEFSATDSARHRFTAEASLALAGTPTLTGAAAFDDFKLFCGGMMNGEIDGGLAASGTTRAMNIAGDLVLGPLNIQIPGARVQSDIPKVPIQWVRPGDTLPAMPEAPSTVALDITVAAPRRLFVRGRGLDAEFKGDLAITGTLSEPALRGQFEKERGTFNLLDREMALDTASMLFQGPIPPSPFLNVVASTTVDGTTITVTLSGSAQKPELVLSSSPSLPQDEALALLLFGRQLSSISPFEALQLAQAARTLAGLDEGPGVIGTLRNKLGLDRLQVGTDEENNVNVNTGKYVTDDVYVGVVQGTKPEDREIVTEITLTPSVSGKTAVDSLGNQSVGMEWKRDY